MFERRPNYEHFALYRALLSKNIINCFLSYSFLIKNIVKRTFLPHLNLTNSQTIVNPYVYGTIDRCLKNHSRNWLLVLVKNWIWHLPWQPTYLSNLLTICKLNIWKNLKDKIICQNGNSYLLYFQPKFYPCYYECTSYRHLNSMGSWLCQCQMWRDASV